MLLVREIKLRVHHMLHEGNQFPMLVCQHVVSSLEFDAPMGSRWIWEGRR